MADFQDAYGLPSQLPPLRLPPDAELARQAREVPLIRELAALAEWLGTNGKPVDDDQHLRKDALEEAVAVLGVPPERLRALWKYALSVSWAEIDYAGDLAGGEGETGGESAGEGPGDAGEGQSDGLGEGRAFPGETAGVWAEGIGADGEDPDDEAALDAWGSAFAAVLSESLCAAADGGPAQPAGRAPRGLPGKDEPGEAGQGSGLAVHDPGAALAMVLFLGRREGLSREEVRSLVWDLMTGELPPERARRAFDDWVSAHGNPADILLGQLAEAGAVTLPETEDGTIGFTPLALREMRLQLTDEGVDIPLLTATAGELTATELLALAEGIGAGEFEAEADAWLMAHGPQRSSVLLLDVAAGSGPARRLTAVSVVTRAGQAAERAWRDNIDVPALRPYAKVALASLAVGPGMASAAPGGLALLPETIPADSLPDELRPLPDDLAWLATDVLSLTCADADTSPHAIATAFADSVPEGEEANILDAVWRGPHPDAERVLAHIGRFHPDKKIAKEARRAAHKAASRRGGEGASD